MIWMKESSKLEVSHHLPSQFEYGRQAKRRKSDDMNWTLEFRRYVLHDNGKSDLLP